MISLLSNNCVNSWKVLISLKQMKQHNSSYILSWYNWNTIPFINSLYFYRFPRFFLLFYKLFYNSKILILNLDSNAINRFWKIPFQKTKPNIIFIILSNFIQIYWYSQRYNTNNIHEFSIATHYIFINSKKIH